MELGLLIYNYGHISRLTLSTYATMVQKSEREMGRVVRVPDAWYGLKFLGLFVFEIIDGDGG